MNGTMSGKENSLTEMFAQFMKEKRMAKGWDQVKLAEMVYGDIRRKTFINSIENGKRNITFVTAEPILRALGARIKFEED